MKWVEETYARDLHEDLIRHFEAIPSTTELSIQGSGVHWKVIARRGKRSGIVNCFGMRGPEYLCSFDEKNQTIAMGRTTSKQDVIRAITDWLNESALKSLHESFAFVDNQKRELLKISKGLVEAIPELGNLVTHDLKHIVCDLYELWITQGDRACKISYWGKNQFADACFLWDQCELFRFTARELLRLGEVLKRWLCDYAMPSVLRTEFPWVEIGDLATYYEQGRPIEGEFLMSWNSIERFYGEAEIPQRDKILRLIEEMRQRGYDKTLRAGQSLYSLVLSRSRRHGLRQGQANLQFHFHLDRIEIHAHFEKGEIITVPKISFTRSRDAIEAISACKH